MQLASNETATRALDRRWLTLSWVTTWLLIVYFAIILPVERLAPIINRWQVAILLFPASAAAVYFAARALLSRMKQPTERAKELWLLALVLLVTALSSDIAFTAYTNVSPKFEGNREKLYAERVVDEHMWDGELMPDQYMPTHENFWIYKPGQRRSATVYGEQYYPALSRHAGLDSSVLQLHNVEFIIDRYGLRNANPPDNAGIFVLGDSFCFGYHTTQSAIFSELLSARLNQPVYNMGVSGFSPLQEFLMLRYFLTTYPNAFRPRHLLWFIFEGNDLEGTYAEENMSAAAIRDAAAGKKRPKTLNDILKGTIVETVSNIPAVIRRQSIVRRFMDGSVTLPSGGLKKTTQNHLMLDGETLLDPIYHSPKYGYKILRQQYLDRAGNSLADVMNHPNAARLAVVFDRMKALANKHAFDVTVVTAPTSVRLYKDYFEDLPPVTAEPYFLRYATKLADKEGFAHLDLYALMTPFARNEYLYYADDTHWNERGHQVVADVLAEHLGHSLSR
jgi:SGNH hydrolase-like domain, acetyltransferase AlgX